MDDWLLVDDNREEGEAFARNLSDGEALSVKHVGAHCAYELLDAGTLAPAGVLMDVDLSNELGHRHTGPGMSQDIRVAQQKNEVPPFPIVRFSMRTKVLENIGSDASSDDIFDLKIEKDGLSDDDLRTSAINKLVGLRKLYDAVIADGTNVLTLLAINEEKWSLWGNDDFASDFEQGNRVHLKVSPLIRLLVHPGVLVEEDLLAFRLGVDREASQDWPDLLEQLSAFKYAGVAHEFFPRWWARAIEQWWQDELGHSSPLAGCSIQERLEVLQTRFANLAPMTMPSGSMGDRPWRYCMLTLERYQARIPVDPSRSVRMKPRSLMPSWLDPLYATLGIALENRDDQRLDGGDLRRLQALTRGKA